VRLVKARSEARRLRRADLVFDAERRVDTGGWVPASALVTASPNRRHTIRYQPTSVDEFGELMAMLDVDHTEYVFVDYGSGKGRVLMLAADYPFKRIIGVEFSPPLVEIAERNIATLGADGARIENLAIDATEFEPPLAPLVAYLFNPFAPTVARPVFERLRASLDEHPRPAYVVVTGPPELAAAIEEAGFSPVEVERLAWRTRGVYTYVPVHVGAAIGAGVTTLGTPYAA
jgi:hypothetical protein